MLKTCGIVPAAAGPGKGQQKKDKDMVKIEWFLAIWAEIWGSNPPPGILKQITLAESPLESHLDLGELGRQKGGAPGRCSEEAVKVLRQVCFVKIHVLPLSRYLKPVFEGWVGSRG